MVHVLPYVSHAAQPVAEGCTCPQAVEPDISKLVVSTKFEEDVSVILEKAHLQCASARV